VLFWHVVVKQIHQCFKSFLHRLFNMLSLGVSDGNKVIFSVYLLDS
jgi:hypothetical protein